MNKTYNPANHHKLYGLVNKSGINSPKRTTSVGDLVRSKYTEDPNELWQMVKDNSMNDLDEEVERCIRYVNENDPSIPAEDVQGFIWKLFTEWSIQGFKAERRAIEWLNKTYDDCVFSPANSECDNKYSVDIMCSKNGSLAAGIQVKPESYRNAPNWQVKADKNKNEKFVKQYGVPVKYLYYTIKKKGDNKTIKFEWDVNN